MCVCTHAYVSMTMCCHCSVTQSCPNLWSHGLQHTRLPCPSPSPELAQTLVHWVDDATQPFFPLSSPSPPAFNLSQHQDLLQWVGSSHHVAKVLELQLQHQSFQWIFRVDFLKDWLVWFPCCSRDSLESSPAPQFKSIKSSVLSLHYGPTLISIHDYWKNHSFDDTIETFVSKVMTAF